MPSTLSYLLAVIIAAAPALALSFQGVQISGVTWQNGVQPSFLVGKMERIACNMLRIPQAFVPAATTAEACVKECQKTSGCSVVTCVYLPPTHRDPADLSTGSKARAIFSRPMPPSAVSPTPLPALAAACSSPSPAPAPTAASPAVRVHP
jgi:hypothetical protein